MKNIVKITLLTGILSAQADIVNVEAFGNKFNGWNTKTNHHYDKATYEIDNRKYRTVKPTETAGPDGTSFVSTRIETASRVGSGAICFLETTFDSVGQLLAAAVKIHTDDRRIDSGTVVASYPVDGESESGALSPTNQLIIDLFSSLDSKIEKLNQGTEEEIQRRDIFGRTGRLTWELEDLSAVVRHNLNLLLASVGESSSK